MFNLKREKVKKNIFLTLLKSHFILGKKHGITKEEAVEIVTQLAFYSGWAKAWSAFPLINEVYADEKATEEHGGAFGMGEPNNSICKIIVIPANVKHWLGAKKDRWFSHIAVEVPGENTSNEWCEEVTDEEYDKL